MLPGYTGSLALTPDGESEVTVCFTDMDIRRDGQPLSKITSCSELDSEGKPAPDTRVIPGVVTMNMICEFDNDNGTTITDPIHLEVDELCAVELSWGRTIVGNFRVATWQYAGSTSETIRQILNLVSTGVVTVT